MLHRCAFDARSSVALSAHPWNLLYHSRADFSRRAIFIQFSFPSRRVSLSRVGVRIFSLDPLPLNSFPKNRLPSQTHNIIHFIFHATFSSRQLFLLFRKVGEEKFLGVPLSEWNGKKLFFRFFGNDGIFLKNSRTTTKNYFKVNENIAAATSRRSMASGSLSEFSTRDDWEFSLS